MKKILSLTLVAVMLLSTISLTSCGLLSALDLIFGTPPMSIEELINLGNVTNYSLDQIVYGQKGSTYVEFFHYIEKYDGTDQYRAQMENGKITIMNETYSTMIDGKGYYILPTNEYGNYILEPMPEDVYYSETPIFGEYVAKKCYSTLRDAGNNTYKMQYDVGNELTVYYEFTVTNNKIVALTETHKYHNNGDKWVYTYYDIGTTVVNIPEYITEEAVRTTVTEEEWIAAMSMTNFTLIMLDGNGEEYSIKYTEEGCIYLSTNTMKVFIDGYVYNLEKSGDSWVAKSEGSYAALERMLPLIAAFYPWSDLTYDEANKVYVSSDGSITMTFADGVLVSIGSSRFVDVGTTVIDFPEYTVAAAKMTYDEFVQLGALTNYSVKQTNYEYQDGEWIAVHHIDSQYDGYDKYHNIYGHFLDERYTTMIDGKAHTISKDGETMKYVAVVMINGEYYSPDEMITFYQANLYYPYLERVDENTYTIEYTYEDGGMSYYEITVEIGQITAMTQININSANTKKYVYIYYNIGTTVVEFPEFTYGE